MSKIREGNKFNPQSTDAKIWAKEFMRLYDNNKLRPINAPDWVDEGLMIGWFANAIMAGYDEARRKYAEEAIKKTRLTEEEIINLITPAENTMCLIDIKAVAHAIYEAGRKKE